MLWSNWCNNLPDAGGSQLQVQDNKELVQLLEQLDDLNPGRKNNLHLIPDVNY